MMVQVAGCGHGPQPRVSNGEALPSTPRRRRGGGGLKMLHLEDGLDLNKAGLVIKDRQGGRSVGRDLCDLGKQETSLSLSSLICKLGEMSSRSSDIGSMDSIGKTRYKGVKGPVSSTSVFIIPFNRWES